MVVAAAASGFQRNHPAILPDLPDGWVVVERCDYCEQYPDDLTAAEVVCDDAMWLRCASGSDHAVGGPRGR